MLPKNPPISVYFGGGTPSLLPPEMIENIRSWISPPASCEITLEVNPENATPELIGKFKEVGINRVSLGVQSFDPALPRL